MKRGSRLRIVSAAALALALAGAVAAWRVLAEPPHFFADGQNPVVLYGDSISQEGAYVRYLEAFLHSRFPDWDLRILNLGVNGDTAGLRRRGGQKALEREITAFSPRAAVMCFGMNDAREADYLEQYPQRLRRLVSALQNRGARALILSPTAEEGGEPNQPAGSAYNHRLAQLRDAVEAVAAETGARFIDLHRPFVAAVEAGRNVGVLPAAPDEESLVPDGVHPSETGHLLMAVEILRALNVPGNISFAEIDAAERRVTAGQGCSVEVMRDAPPEELVFRRRDRCLPWPVPAMAAERLATIPGYESFLDELSGWLLTVSNLRPGTLYQLEVNGHPAGIHASEDLAAGINLTSAASDTVGGAALMQLLEEREALWVERYRKVTLFDLPDWAQLSDSDDAAEHSAFAPVAEWLELRRDAELTRLDGEIATLERRIREVCRPGTHLYRLRPAPRVLAPDDTGARQSRLPNAARGLMTPSAP